MASEPGNLGKVMAATSGAASCVTCQVSLRDHHASYHETCRHIKYVGWCRNKNEPFVGLFSLYAYNREKRQIGIGLGSQIHCLKQF